MELSYYFMECSIGCRYHRVFNATIHESSHTKGWFSLASPSGLKEGFLRHVCLFALFVSSTVHPFCMYHSFVLILDSHSAIYIHSTQRSSCSLRVMNPCISSR